MKSFEFDPFSDEKQMPPDEVHLLKFRTFTNTFKHDIHNLHSILNSSASDDWDSVYFPFQLDLRPFEQYSVLRMITETENATLERIIKVFTDLAIETDMLEKTAKSKIYSILLLYGQNQSMPQQTGGSTVKQLITEAEIGLEMSRFIPILQQIYFFTKRVQDVATNLVRQLGSVFNQKGKIFQESFRNVHLAETWNCLKKLMIILITIDSIVQSNDKIEEGFQAFKKILRIVTNEPTRFGVNAAPSLQGKPIQTPQTQTQGVIIPQIQLDQSIPKIAQQSSDRSEGKDIRSLNIDFQVVEATFSNCNLFQTFINTPFHVAEIAPTILNPAFTAALIRVIREGINGIIASMGNQKKKDPISILFSQSSVFLTSITPQDLSTSNQSSSQQQSTLLTPTGQCLQSIYSPILFLHQTQLPLEEEIIGVSGLLCLFPKIYQDQFPDRKLFLEFWEIFKKVIPVFLIIPSAKATLPFFPVRFLKMNYESCLEKMVYFNSQISTPANGFKEYNEQDLMDSAEIMLSEMDNSVKLRISTLCAGIDSWALAMLSSNPDAAAAAVRMMEEIEDNTNNDYMNQQDEKTQTGTTEKLAPLQHNVADQTISNRVKLVQNGLRMASGLQHLITSYVGLHIALSFPFPPRNLKLIVQAAGSLKLVQSVFFQRATVITEGILYAIDLLGLDASRQLQSLLDRHNIQIAMTSDQGERDQVDACRLACKMLCSGSGNTTALVYEGHGQSLFGDKQMNESGLLSNTDSKSGSDWEGIGDSSFSGRGGGGATIHRVIAARILSDILLRRIDEEDESQSRNTTNDALVTKKIHLRNSLSKLKTLVELPDAMKEACDCSFLYCCRDIFPHFFGLFLDDVSLCQYFPAFCLALHDPLHVVSISGKRKVTPSQQKDAATHSKSIAEAFIDQTLKDLQDSLVGPLCAAVETRVRLDVQETLNPMAQYETLSGLASLGATSTTQQVIINQGTYQNQLAQSSSTPLIQTFPYYSPSSSTSSSANSAAAAAAVASAAVSLGRDANSDNERIPLILCALNPVRLFGEFFSIRTKVEQYLSSTFYNLTTVNLSDWRTYNEMASLAAQKYGLLIEDNHLPIQTLNQGLDVLEVAKNLNAFVGQYAYCINSQLFVEIPRKSSKNVNAMAVQHFANSIRTHGTGILETTVNLAYNLLTVKMGLFVQFLQDEHIKNFLSKEYRFWKGERQKRASTQQHGQQHLNLSYPYERAEELLTNMKRLGGLASGETFMDKFRLLIIDIGNVLGFVRMLRSGSQRFCSESNKFVPAAESDQPFAAQVTIANLSLPSQSASASLDRTLDNLSLNVAEGTDFFQLLLAVFRSTLGIDKKSTTTNDANSADRVSSQNLQYIRMFPLFIPALTITFTENLIQQKESLSKSKSNSAFCNDGFIMGVSFALALLNLTNAFRSLNWFESARMHAIKIIRDTEDEQGRLNKKQETEKANMLQITLRKWSMMRDEQQLLSYTFDGARVFFKE